MCDTMITAKWPDTVIINKHLSSVSTEPQILTVRGETYRNFTECVQKNNWLFIYNGA